MDTREEGRSCPTGDLYLAFCKSCGFIQNVVFDATVHEYSTRYEETQGFSPTFKKFATELVDGIVERHDLRNKSVLEVGCGKGEFLVLMCEAGNNRGIGIDPGYVPERTTSEAASRIQFIQDFYSEKYTHLPADLVACRHTLEHIHETRKFLEMIRRSIGPRMETVVFFELPDVERILKDQAFEDIYYEHCSYFTLGSLARLFRLTGFEVTRLEKGFGDQYLLIEARPSDNAADQAPLPNEETIEQLARDVDRFTLEVPSIVKDWKKEFGEHQAEGRKVVLWGSGSKAVSFMTTTGIRNELEYVVDINPYRHGKFMPGTGHEIVAPSFLEEYRPDAVVVMNEIYVDEIRTDLRGMGLDPIIKAV